MEEIIRIRDSEIIEYTTEDQTNHSGRVIGLFLCLRKDELLRTIGLLAIFLIASDRQREFIEVIYRCEEVSFNKHRKVKIMGKDRPVNFLMFE